MLTRSEYNQYFMTDISKFSVSIVTISASRGFSSEIFRKVGLLTEQKRV